jgi:ATP-dependent DNA helicase DinG
MRDELVAVDLETTGLDPMRDAIIEVGAVRFKNGVIIEEFQTMVHPNMSIPPYITFLNNIRDEDVAGAPRIEQVLPQIARFVGDAPVIAHNISLDMGFLQQRHHILLDNASIDTYDLASVLMPRAPRYNLNSLAQQVGIELENAHRALDDARATALLYWKLWEKALSLPASTLLEIEHAARDLGWSAGGVFAAALRERDQADPSEAASTPVAGAEPEEFQTLRPAATLSHVDRDEVVGIVGPDGVLSKNMPAFEYRPQQVEMVSAITDAFNNSRHLMIEAGTGTGKTIGYLVPAILWSKTNGERVAISTNTINLQDQLINHDIPLLRQALGIDFMASVMKGRSNYLCPRRLAAVRRRRPTSIGELRTLAKILVWLLETSSGDRGEISLRGPAENGIWQRLSAQDEGCALHRCESIMQGTCPFYKARQAAEGANLLIINHALLIADAGAENRVLPEYRYVIIDEAHQLEDAVTSGLSFHVDQAVLLRRLADLGGPNRGLLGEILSAARSHAPDKHVLRLEQFIQSIDAATTMMETHILALFASLNQIVDDIHPSRSTEYLTMVRITTQHRGKSGFAQVQTAWSALDEFFEVIAGAMRQLTQALSRLQPYQIEGLEDLINSAETAARYLTEIRDQLDRFVTEPDANTIYWISITQGETNAVIHTAPLHIGPMVEQYLWHEKASVILTSATLRTHESFDYLRERLYADSVDTLDLGSPFNYHESTLVYLPNDIPEPGERQQYQRSVERGIIELAAALDGRVLALFTSYAQLRQTAQAITPRLSLGNIVVYDQSDGSSRQSLLEGFKSTEKAVLLGTRSFWEGIDIPGESLSALVIARLPFTVPSDPIFSARSETYTDMFNQYALPDAVLRFRQGFGRLIRTSTDRGVVVIFDSRVLSKRYGTVFLESLPDCTMQDGPLEALPEIAKNWIARGK